MTDATHTPARTSLGNASTPSLAYSLHVIFDPTTLDTLDALDARRALIAAGARVEERTAPDGYRRAWTICTSSADALQQAAMLIRGRLGSAIRALTDQTLELHRGGLVRTRPKRRLASLADLALADQPGATRIARLVANDAEQARALTGAGRTVALITDGSDPSNEGDSGSSAARPFVEAKAAVYASLTDLDAVPLTVADCDAYRLADVINALAPNFAAIHLDAIAAPDCYRLLGTLHDRLSIPVVHTHEHLTAATVLAALLNALRATKRAPNETRVVVHGIGAAALGITRILLGAGLNDIVLCTTEHVLQREERESLPAHLANVAGRANPREVRGKLGDALRDADVLIDTGNAAELDGSLQTMREQAILFVLGEPVGSDFDEFSRHAAVVATGALDRPNALTDAVAYPGLVSGLIAQHAGDVTPLAVIRAARAIARHVGGPARRTRILPNPFDPRLVDVVADAVARITPGHTRHHAGPRPDVLGQERQPRSVGSPT